MSDWATGAANAVLIDLSDRHGGIGHALDQVPPRKMTEIVDAMATIIRDAAPGARQVSPQNERAAVRWAVLSSVEGHATEVLSIHATYHEAADAAPKWTRGRAYSVFPIIPEDVECTRT